MNKCLSTAAAPCTMVSCTKHNQYTVSMSYSYKLAIIEWVDAFDGDETWVYKDEYNFNPVLPITVGWLLEDLQEGYVSLVSTFCQFKNKPDMYSNMMHVPSGMVKSITYVDIPDNISKPKQKNRARSNAD